MHGSESHGNERGVSDGEKNEINKLWFHSNL